MRLIDADAMKADLEGDYFDRCAVIKMIDAAPTVEQWISVEDQLPETEHKVLAYNKRDGMFIAEIKEYPLAFLWTDQKHSYRIVEYWRELPDPPKEGDRE